MNKKIMIMFAMLVATTVAFAHHRGGPGGPRGGHHGGGFRPAPMHHVGGYRCAPPVHHYRPHGYGYYGGRWVGPSSYTAGFVTGVAAGAVISTAVDGYGNYIVPGRANCGHVYYTAPAAVPATYSTVYTPPVVAAPPAFTTVPVVPPALGAGVRVGPVGVGIGVVW